MKHKFTITCLAALFVIALQAQTPGFTGKPIYEIVTKRAGNYLGTIKVELFPNIAWHHVRNFDSLVSVHFFDTTAFHRVVPGFVIQGGDPNSRHGAMSTWGQGQAGQPTVDAEFSVAKHVRGRFSAARSSNINSATSQFFICVATAGNLDTHYSLYGQVTSGMNIVDSIVSSPRFPTTYTDTPQQKIEMFVTRNGSNDTVPQPPVLVTPANGTTDINYNSTVLKWNRVSDGIIYHLEVANDSLFTDTVMTRDIGAAPTAVYISQVVTDLTDNSVYYWRVMTNNGGHFSNYSQVYSFRTKAVTGIPVNNADAGITVFPNPTITGKLSLANVERGSRVEVYDLAGKLVYETTASDVIVNLDLSRKDKGQYVYKVTNSEGRSHKGKLIVQ